MAFALLRPTRLRFRNCVALDGSAFRGAQEKIAAAAKARKLSGNPGFTPGESDRGKRKERIYFCRRFAAPEGLLDQQSGLLAGGGEVE